MNIHGLRRRRDTEWSNTPVDSASHRPQSEAQCLLAAARRKKKSLDYRYLLGTESYGVRSNSSQVLAIRVAVPRMYGVLRRASASRNKISSMKPPKTPRSLPLSRLLVFFFSPSELVANKQETKERWKEKISHSPPKKSAPILRFVAASDWTWVAFPRQCRPRCGLFAATK